MFQLHIHLVWCTKYRKRVLKDDVGVRLRELCRQICSDMGVEILSGVIAKDHVHVLVSMPPQVSVSKMIQKLKGKSSYKLQREFSSLRKNSTGGKGCGREGILRVAREISRIRWSRITSKIMQSKMMPFMLSRTSSHTLQPPWGGGLVAGFSLNSTYSAHLKPPASAGG